MTKPAPATVKLTTFFHPDYRCYVAFDGDCIATSTCVGEGSTPVDARSDFWSLYHDGPTASLCNEGDHWSLYDGRTSFLFDTRDEAIEYADKHFWQISR